MSSSSSPPRALAILPNWLGDLVMVAPALLCLRARGPLLALGSPAALSLLRELDVVDSTLAYERHGRDRGLGLFRIARQAAAFSPECAYAFGPSLRAGALAWLSGARQCFGYGGEGRALFLNRSRPRLRRDRHLAQQWLELVSEDTRCERFLPLRLRRAAQERWQSERARWPRWTGQPYVALAAGATYGATKRWPHFAALARALAAKGLLPIFVGGHAASERRLCAELAESCEGIDASGRTDLPLLAALLAEAALCVGNDSGPAHLAAGLGTPTLTIFGSSSPAWTAPLGPRTATIGPSPIECSPCFARDCKIGILCLSELSVQDVATAATALLAGQDAQR
jgi:heptosyltransferase-2